MFASNLTIMLTLDYLKSILKKSENGGLPFLTDDKQFLESAAGYDGIVELLQTKNIDVTLILEHNQIGEFSFRPGGFHVASQSLWIMRKVGFNEDRTHVQHEAFGDMKDILCMFGEHQHDAAFENWEWNHIPYGIRNAGANYTGYEFTLQFDEDTDLSYGAIRQPQL